MADNSKNENNQKTPVEVLKDEIEGSPEGIKSKYQARVYGVPQELRKLNESAYTPSLVSIGPLHRHQESQMIRDVKLFYMKCLFQKVRDGGAAIKNCFGEMESILPEVQKFYGGEEVNAEMLVIDGCFILELLCRYTEILTEGYKKERRTSCHPNSESSDCFSSLLTGLLCKNEESNSQSDESQESNRGHLPDPIFSFPLTRVAVQHDLLLLENQLPLSVLKKLFDHTLGCIRGHHLRLSDYILNYFHEVLNIGHDCRQKIPILSSTPDQHEVDLKAYDHILHFLHHHYLPDKRPQPDKVGGQLDNKFMPFASHLDSSGVKFEGNKHQFKVQFKPRLCTCRRASFSIPTLLIDDSTELVLRNIIAFEKCVPYVSGYFTSYAYLLDGLINTEEDFQVLEEAEVIRNRLGTTKEASDLFNSLCKDVAIGGFHFAKICDEVVKYNKHCWLAALPMTIQHLKRKWSANPWAFVAFLVAFTAFAMQAIDFITNHTG